MLKQMDHDKYPKSLKRKTEAQLRYIMMDAKSAAEANPENPNNGYYEDEYHYCAMELSRRSERK